MKGKSLLEVILVFVLFEIIFFAYKSTELLRTEIQLLRWSYLAGSLMIIIPAFILVAARKNRTVYGLSLANWKETLDSGMISALVLGFLSIGIGTGLFMLIGTTLSPPVDTLKRVILSVIILYLIITLLNKRDKTRDPENPPNPVPNVLCLIALLSVPIVVGLVANKLTLKVVSTVAWQFVFSGFGEEFLYRGYIQSRVNEEYGRPFSFMGVNFGLGLIVSSLLFGLAHVLNPFSPFTGHYELNWWWGVSAGVTGFVFGLVREKTGSIIPSSIAHGLPDAIGEPFALMFSL